VSCHVSAESRNLRKRVEPAFLEVNMLQGIGCKLGWHRWGPLEGDYWGGFHTCTYCDNTKRLPSEHQPEMHDKMK